MKKKIYYAVPIFILALLVIGFVASQPANSLTMDVNPSIEIVTNRLNRVVEINPLNDDAKELLKGFDPKDKNLEKTVNDLVDLMILTGYIKGGEDNIVMITVSDDSVDNQLVEKVNRAIMAMLENKQIEATILNQAISKKYKEEKKTGVQLAAEKLQEIDESLSAEQINSMTVRELIRYSKENNIPIENLFKVAAGNIDKSIKEKNVISKEEAKKIALEKVNGEIIKIKIDDLYDDDGPEYEIKIKSEGSVYEIEIDAITGKIKEFEREDDGDVDKEELKGKISADKAKSIALERTGGGKIKEFELDDGEYKIEIKENGKEYEIEIDAKTGKVKEFEVDDVDHDDDDYKEKSKGRISADKAKSIALELTNGGKIVEFELDDDEYEIEIIANGKEYEIEIDANTGQVLDFEVEDDD